MEFKNLIHQMLQKDPDSRISAKEAIALPMFLKSQSNTNHDIFQKEWQNLLPEKQNCISKEAIETICTEILSKPSFKLAYQTKRFMNVPDVLNPLQR